MGPGLPDSHCKAIELHAETLSMIIKIIKPDTEEYKQMIDLRITALLDPIGVPAHYIVPEKEKDDILNCFGNLCLISRSSNSAYNNDLPAQKRHDSSGRNESLKQAVMFSSFNGEKWNTDEILLHHEEMIELIKSYTA